MDFSDHELPALGAKLSTILAAGGGGIASGLLGQGAIRHRVIHGVVGVFFAIYASPLVMDFLGKFMFVSSNAERGVTFIVGLVGGGLAEFGIGFVNRLRDRAADAADITIDKKFGGGS